MFTNITTGQVLVLDTVLKITTTYTYSEFIFIIYILLKTPSPKNGDYEVKMSVINQ